MRIAFDASSLAFKDKTGTGVYTEELINAYEKRFVPQDQVIHTYRLSRRFRGRHFLRPLGDGITRETLIDPVTSFRGLHYDIFHGLNTRLPILQHAKMIATVFDLFSIYGDFSREEFKSDQKLKLSQMIMRAHHIIVSATYTKNLLENKLGIDPQKMSLVPLGVKEHFRISHDKEKSKANVNKYFGLVNPFVFFAGALEKRKNVVGLIEAFAYFVRDYKKPLDLVLAGPDGFEFDLIRKTIKESGVEDKIKTLGFVNEMELTHLYTACDVFAFISFEEGYGMPVIEAMACGAPVLSSNTTSLPEVGNGFSWLVNPKSREEIAAGLRTILDHGPQVFEKIKSGERYARNMSWQKVAELTRDVYQKVLEI